MPALDNNHDIEARTKQETTGISLLTLSLKITYDPNFGKLWNKGWMILLNTAKNLQNDMCFFHCCYLKAGAGML